MDMTALAADFLLVVTSYSLGIATGMYYIKNKMESKAEEMLGGLYED